MNDPTSTREISAGLLKHLRQVLDEPAIEYAGPLARLQGGFEAQTYRFALRGAGAAWARPLVLRVYPVRFGASAAGAAIWESTIQNLLADAGYPVARVRLTCTDASVLGGAFLVMNLLEGEPMMSPETGVPPEAIPGLLGRTHAALHDVDPAPIVAAFRERGLDERRYRFDGRMEALAARAAAVPWLGEAVDWLMAHRPPEPERLSICHGDFHPLNLLVRDGRVTGVLDWSGLMVADPAADVATTIVLTRVSAKHNFGLAEWEPVVELYLDAYRALRALDVQHLDYYKVRRSVIALLDGADGQAIWQHPAIVKDLVQIVQEKTGIRVQT